MARPSKEELIERNNKINSGLYNRDHEYYLDMENHLSELTTHEKSYKFCIFCRDRTQEFGNRRYGFRSGWKFDENIYGITLVPTSTVYMALVHNLGISKKSFLQLVDKCFHTVGYLNFHLLKEELSDEELFEIHDISTEDFTTDIRSFISLHRYNMIQPNETMASTKKAYVEIDLSKSLEDIIEAITKVKKSFDKDHSLVYSPLEAMGYTISPFTCNIKDCDIFKHKSPKPLEGKMIDLLFIYDCKKAGLHNEFIIDEITRYWKDVKKISTEKFYHFDEYYKQAKELIDDERHEDYLTGVTIKPPLC